MSRLWTLTYGESPVVAAAIHDGHDVRAEVAELMGLSDEERLREEDPYTGDLTGCAPNRVVCHRSRFEVDLNRPRTPNEKIVYIDPADAWGLRVWRETPPDDMITRSMAEYASFYREMTRFLKDVERSYGAFVVLDIHTYNHLRGGPDGEPADPAANQEINIGTGSLDRELWGPLVDRLIDDLRRGGSGGREFDVRENVKFRGGHFPQWVHRTFRRTGCAVALEIKKFFMNEWTGERDEREFSRVLRALESAVPGLVEEVERVCERNSRGSVMSS